MAVELPYTLQTWVGMVLLNGRPQQRACPKRIANINSSEEQSLLKSLFELDQDTLANMIPHVTGFEDAQAYKPSELLLNAAEDYLRNEKAVGTCSCEKWTDQKRERVAANLAACVSEVTKGDLKNYVRSKTRMDLEQAAAVVVSAFMHEQRVDNGVWLLKQLGGVLATSYMWIDPERKLAMSADPKAPMSKLASLLQQSAAKQHQDIPLAASYQELVPLLMRVRSTRRAPMNRCLHIPEWMFEEARIQAPEPFSDFFGAHDQPLVTRTEGPHPMADISPDTIWISRRHLKSIQRRIFGLFKFWRPDVLLRKRIRNLEDRVLYASDWIEDRVFEANDVALLSHYFFHFQRRLQRRVVSDMGWIGFLGKGEGKKLFQNNVHLKSTFEEVLLEIADANEEGVVVAVGNESTAKLIDETCLLMKQYVDYYGQGKKDRLVADRRFWRSETRGTVADYNLLCEILSQLRQQAQGEGLADIPGGARKFLALDIMFSNDAWDDDAFAGNEKQSWEVWLEKRGLIEKEDEEDWDLIVNEKDEKFLPLR